MYWYHPLNMKCTPFGKGSVIARQNIPSFTFRCTYISFSMNYYNVRRGKCAVVLVSNTFLGQQLHEIVERQITQRFASRLSPLHQGTAYFELW